MRRAFVASLCALLIALGASYAEGAAWYSRGDQYNSGNFNVKLLPRGTLAWKLETGSKIVGAPLVVGGTA